MCWNGVSCVSTSVNSGDAPPRDGCLHLALMLGCKLLWYMMSDKLLTVLPRSNGPKVQGKHGNSHEGRGCHTHLKKLVWKHNMVSQGKRTSALSCA